jgi:hypothetical protein
MTESAEDAKRPYAERIAKLLTRAEGTDNQHEADLANEMAARLMEKYAISADLLAQARGAEIQDHIVEERIEYGGIFHMAKWDIGKAIATNVPNVEHMISRPGGSHSTLILIGFSKDVERVKLLDASLQLQASSAMQRWWRDQNKSWMTPMQKSKERRGFLVGYANGVSMKLARARREGREDAIDEEAKRSARDASEVRKSTELVLVSKGEQVDQWIDSKYGNTIHKVKRNYQTGGWSAKAEGYREGQRANTGDPSIGANRKGISGRR